jgi:peptide/nickel transport system substrate-binding protein
MGLPKPPICGLDYPQNRPEAIMEQDPPLLPMAWEQIIDVWWNYVKGHNLYEYFGVYDVVRFDTFWLDK